MKQQAMYYATAKEMEMLDRLAVKSGLEIRQMMELAGWHMLAVFHKLGIPQSAKVTVVCGKGNKGGDGLSAARHLINHRWAVEVVLLSKELSTDAAHHLRLLRKMQAPVYGYAEQKRLATQAIQSSDVLIDALIGYHLNGAPRGVFGEVIKLMNVAKKRIIAYDLPTGLDATTGQCFEPCVRAAETLTLALPKRGFLAQEGKKTSGKLFLADIGIPKFLYDQISPNCRPSFEQPSGDLISL